MIIQRRGEAWIHQRFIHELDSWHEPIPVPVPLAEIKYADNPQIRINKHETTEMPFRYMVDDDLMPIMPQVGPPVIVLLRITCKWRSDFVTKMLNVNFYTLGMIELIQKDSEKGIGDLLWGMPGSLSS